MANLPRRALMSLAGVAVLAAIFYAGSRREDPNAPPPTLVGQAAPALTLEPLADLRPLRHEDLTAPGMKLVNFWASWCTPCRVEHPNLAALTEETGIPIYGVNFKDQPDKAMGFLAELGNFYAAVAADPDGRTARDWGVFGLPETFVVDGDGRIVARVAGPVTERTLERTIRPALEASGRN